MPADALQNYTDLIKAGTKQEGSMGVTPAAEKPLGPAAVPSGAFAPKQEPKRSRYNVQTGKWE
jgi:hypothetical protein